MNDLIFKNYFWIILQSVFLIITAIERKDTTELISNKSNGLMFNNREYSITNVIKIYKNYNIIQKKCTKYFYTNIYFNYKISKIIHFLYLGVQPFFYMVGKY